MESVVSHVWASEDDEDGMKGGRGRREEGSKEKRSGNADSKQVANYYNLHWIHLVQPSTALAGCSKG